MSNLLTTHKESAGEAFFTLLVATLSILASGQTTSEFAWQTIQNGTPRERTLLFVGDVMLSRGVGAKMQAEGDWTFPFREIASLLSAADLTFGNLECPVGGGKIGRAHV